MFISVSSGSVFFTFETSKEKYGELLLDSSKSLYRDSIKIHIVFIEVFNFCPSIYVRIVLAECLWRPLYLYSPIDSFSGTHIHIPLCIRHHFPQNSPQKVIQKQHFATIVCAFSHVYRILRYRSMVMHCQDVFWVTLQIGAYFSNRQH